MTPSAKYDEIARTAQVPACDDCTGSEVAVRLGRVLLGEHVPGGQPLDADRRDATCPGASVSAARSRSAQAGRW